MYEEEGKMHLNIERQFEKKCVATFMYEPSQKLLHYGKQPAGGRFYIR